MSEFIRQRIPYCECGKKLAMPKCIHRILSSAEERKFLFGVKTESRSYK